MRYLAIVALSMMIFTIPASCPAEDRSGALAPVGVAGGRSSGPSVSSVAPAVTTSPVLPVEPPTGPPTAGPGFPERREACPSTAYINCMPPVPKERRSMCSPAYLHWIKEHCPGVKVVY